MTGNGKKTFDDLTPVEQEQARTVLMGSLLEGAEDELNSLHDLMFQVCMAVEVGLMPHVRPLGRSMYRVHVDYHRHRHHWADLHVHEATNWFEERMAEILTSTRGLIVVDGNGPEHEESYEPVT